MIKKYYVLLLGLLLVQSCTKLETEVPVLTNTVFCTLDIPNLEGSWSTDSVKVVPYRDTMIDTSANVNPQSLFYFLDVFCNDSAKVAHLRYHTTVTLSPVNVAETQNFVTGNDRLYFLAENQVETDSAMAGLQFRIDSLSDTVLNAHYSVQINDSFRIEYDLFFRKN